MTKTNPFAGLLVLAALAMTGCATRAKITTHNYNVPVRVGPIKHLGGSSQSEGHNPYKPFFATVSNDARLIYVGAGFGGVGAGAASYAESESDARQVDKILNAATRECTSPCAADVTFVHLGSVGTFAPLLILDFNTVSILGAVTHAGPTGEAFLKAQTRGAESKQPGDAAGSGNSASQDAADE
ncbi:MAG: hypothetical protein KDH09_16175 [Chrysiogenetes bacterium]|nr:hypothetical protein [Chrysiogenetes bacterium]